MTVVGRVAILSRTVKKVMTKKLTTEMSIVESFQFTTRAVMTVVLMRTVEKVKTKKSLMVMATSMKCSVVERLPMGFLTNMKWSQVMKAKDHFLILHLGQTP